MLRKIIVIQLFIGIAAFCTLGGCDQTDVIEQELESTPFQLATDSCYNSSAGTGCFEWATEGVGSQTQSPCEANYARCISNANCSAALTCFNQSWQYKDWQAKQAACKATNVVAWNQMWHALQCVYCDACTTECATESGFYNCSTYTPTRDKVIGRRK